MLKIIVISDTHNRHGKLVVGVGDVLIHCGDFSEDGHKYEFLDFLSWMSEQKFTHKILVGGNHDKYLLENEAEALELLKKSGIKLLNNTFVEIKGCKIFGSPCSLAYGGFDAFQLKEEEIYALTKSWVEDADIYITHGPPFGILDVSSQSCGSKALRDFYNSLGETKDRLIAFGHIHQSHGITVVNRLHFANAAQAGGGRNGITPDPIKLFWDREGFSWNEGHDMTTERNKR